VLELDRVVPALCRWSAAAGLGAGLDRREGVRGKLRTIQWFAPRSAGGNPRTDLASTEHVEPQQTLKWLAIAGPAFSLTRVAGEPVGLAALAHGGQPTIVA